MGCLPSRPQPSTAATPSQNIPISDIVSFALDRQHLYDQNKPLFVDAHDPILSLSASQTIALVSRLVAGLRAAGLKKGHVVLLHLGNHYLYAALFFAIVGAGGICCGSNLAHQFQDLNHVAHLSGPRFVITTQTKTAIVHELDHQVLQQILRSPSRVEQQLGTTLGHNALGRPLTDLLRHGHSDWMTLSSGLDMKQTMACYYSAPGPTRRTGIPRLVAVSHYALVAQHMALRPGDEPYGGSVVRLTCLPLFNMYRVSETYLTPAIIKVLTNLEDPGLRESLITLRYIGVGGGPIDSVALGKLKAVLHPEATASQIWGMTEFGVAALFRWGEHNETGSVGRLLEGYQIRLVDHKDHGITAEGRPGELLLCSPSLMSGYISTLPSFGVYQEGWFRTDTIKGKLFVVGKTMEVSETPKSTHSGQLSPPLSSHSYYHDTW
ncbi:hypothetical protein QBC45DRAFT_455491 [Copromyces sp. CBS 386.78]|nr:hypothetical protein QBC45DRAFT_455491 [Copromyces sp. CBS 386.78]